VPGSVARQRDASIRVLVRRIRRETGQRGSGHRSERPGVDGQVLVVLSDRGEGSSTGLPNTEPEYRPLARAPVRDCRAKPRRIGRRFICRLQPEQKNRHVSSPGAGRPADLTASESLSPSTRRPFCSSFSRRGGATAKVRSRFRQIDLMPERATTPGAMHPYRVKITNAEQGFTRRRPAVELIAGDIAQADGSALRLRRFVDRPANVYVGRLSDPATEPVIRCVSEPLREHQGHGDAKARAISPQRGSAQLPLLRGPVCGPVCLPMGDDACPCRSSR